MQISEIKKAFDVMDTKKDGLVTKDDLNNLLKGLGEQVNNEIVDD